MLGNTESSKEILGRIEELLKRDLQNDEIRKKSAEEIISELSIYHQEVIFQNAELQRLMLENDALKMRYKGLFEDAPFGYVVYEKDGNIVKANKTFCNLVGISRHNYQGLKFTEYVLPESQDEVYFMVNRVFETGHPEAIEIQIRGENGPIHATVTSNRYVDTEESLDVFGSGSIMIRSAVIDITALKKKQNEILQKSIHDTMTGLYNRRFYDDMLACHDKKEFLPLSVAMIDIDGLKMINDSLGHTFGDQAIITVSKALQSYANPRYLLIRTGGDEIVILFPNTDLQEARNYVSKVEQHIREFVLAGIPLSFSWGIATKWEVSEELMTIIASAEDMMYSRKLLRNVNQKNETILLIMQALFQRNKRIREHSERVSSAAEEFGKKLALDEERVEFLKQLGYLHDIGMASISDEILNKNGALSETEQKELDRHPEVGYRILRSSPGMAELANAVLYHHEWWDGKGYPHGIKMDKIPFESRIINIVDAYDCMKYGPFWSVPLADEEIIKVFQEQSGKQFDPYLSVFFIRYFLSV